MQTFKLVVEILQLLFKNLVILHGKSFNTGFCWGDLRERDH